MKITRRSLIGSAAAVFAVAPFLSLPQTAEASPQTLVSEMQSGPAIDQKRIPVYPSFTFIPPKTSDRSDPLGQCGYAQIQYLVDGRVYGDAITFYDIGAEVTNIELGKEARKCLIEFSTEKLHRINPQAYFVV